MEGNFGTSVTIVPGVTLPLAGTMSPTAIADMFHLNSWCCTNGLGSDKNNGTGQKHLVGSDRWEGRVRLGLGVQLSHIL